MEAEGSMTDLIHSEARLQGRLLGHGVGNGGGYAEHFYVHAVCAQGTDGSAPEVAERVGQPDDHSRDACRQQRCRSRGVAMAITRLEVDIRRAAPRRVACREGGLYLCRCCPLQWMVHGQLDIEPQERARPPADPLRDGFCIILHISSRYTMIISAVTITCAR